MHDTWTAAELDALLGDTRPQLTRRTVLLTTLASGFALAVQPVSADTITTDSVGLLAGPVSIPVADGMIPAYRAMPARGRRLPTVLVVQEIFGVHEFIKDICRRFAKLGYLAIAPQLYARQGDVSAMTDYKQIFSEVVSKVPDQQVLADLDATAQWAVKSGKGNPAALGITGFCWGGRITWLYAAHNPNLKAAVAWYGRLTGESSALQPHHPLELAAKLKAPVLGLYGGQDQGIPISDIESMRTALAAARQESRFIVYPDAPHGFLADYRASYREADAKAGWDECVAWLRSHGVG